MSITPIDFSLLFFFLAILMSICAVILAGLQGKYAFYAAMPVALTFGKHGYSANSKLLLVAISVKPFFYFLNFQNQSVIQVSFAQALQFSTDSVVCGCFVSLFCSIT